MPTVLDTPHRAVVHRRLSWSRRGNIEEMQGVKTLADIATSLLTAPYLLACVRYR